MSIFRVTPEEVDALIDRLEQSFPGFGGTDWGRVWGLCKEVQAAFRNVRYPDREARNEAWSRFQQIRSEASALAEREQSGRRIASEGHRDYILALIERARPAAGLLWGNPDRDTLKALGQTLREAGQLLRRRKGEMLGEHKQACHERLQEVRGIHDIYWQEITRTRREWKANRQDRVRENLRKNRERHGKVAAILERRRAHAAELREKIATAWNEGFRERAEGWLAEAEEEIGELEQRLAEIERWIDEDECKLAGM